MFLGELHRKPPLHVPEQLLEYEARDSPNIASSNYFHLGFLSMPIVNTNTVHKDSEEFFFIVAYLYFLFGVWAGC